MRKVKTAVIGTGFMGKVHSEAIRRLGNVDIVAVAAAQRAERRCIRRSPLASNGRPATTEKFWPTRDRSRPCLHPERAALSRVESCSRGREGCPLRKAA